MLFSKVVRRLIPLCFALVAIFLSHYDLRGQGITTGTVSGMVTDSSGAVVEHAHITATEVSKKGIRLHRRDAVRRGLLPARRSHWQI